MNLFSNSKKFSLFLYFQFLGCKYCSLCSSFFSNLFKKSFSLFFLRSKDKRISFEPCSSNKSSLFESSSEIFEIFSVFSLNVFLIKKFYFNNNNDYSYNLLIK